VTQWDHSTVPVTSSVDSATVSQESAGSNVTSVCRTITASPTPAVQVTYSLVFVKSGLKVTQ